MSQPRHRSPALTALLTLTLAACGAPPAPEPDLQLQSVTAVDGTTFELTFNKAPGAGTTDLANYAVLAYDTPEVDIPPLAQLPETTSAPWRAVTPTAVSVGGGNKVRLTTTPQRGVPYRVKVSGLKDTRGQPIVVTPAGVTALGKDTTPPELLRAEAKSDTTVDLTFSEPLDPRANRTNNVERYTIGGLGVKTATLKPDGRTVTLLTAQQLPDYYTVKVNGVQDTAGLAITGEANTATFLGLDTNVLQFLGASSTGRTGAELRFSRALSDSALNQNLYAITGPGGALSVISASLSADRKRVLLTTAAQNDVQYTVSVTGLQDATGKTLTGGASATFTGVGLDDNVAPRLTGAVSRGNGEVLVSFSEAVQGGAQSAENPANYALEGAGANVGAQLPVLTATLTSDRTSVVLTTRAQSGVTYRVSAAGIRDLAGTPMSQPDPRFAEPVLFLGTGPTTFVDTDGDGLADADELRGWDVAVKYSNGNSVTRRVTSDPGALGGSADCTATGGYSACDTDGDLVSDRDEKNYSSDPRTRDTDTDGLSDNEELNTYFSTPSVQDTDGDGLEDGLEVGTFGTSPVLEDTAGDGINDFDKAIRNNLNPLLAYTPRVRIEQGPALFDLNVKFRFAESNGTTSEQTRNVKSTLESEKTSGYSQSDTDTTQTSFKADVTAKLEASYGYPGGGSVRGSLEASTSYGYAKDKVSTFTSESASKSRDAYAQEEAAATATTSGQLRETVVESGTVTVAISITNDGPVAYNFKNLVLTALVLDKYNGGSIFRPVGTLSAQNPDAISSLTLAPGQTKGPFVFTLDVTNFDLVRKLQADPSAMVLRVANFDLLDEKDRNYAFLSQITSNRTGVVTIDYGPSGVETFRVATNVARNADGSIQGVPMSRVMSIIKRSYTTALDAQQGYEVLSGVGGVSSYDNGTGRAVWVLITDSGRILSANADFDDLILMPGESVKLAYIEDADGDTVSAREEYMYGTSDSLKDSDGDTLGDKEEIRDGWTVTAVTPNYRAYSDPARTDADGDGCLDAAEKTQGLDPRKYDTDGDGVRDCETFPRTGLIGEYLFSGNYTDTSGGTAATPCTVSASPFGTDRFGLGQRALTFGNSCGAQGDFMVVTTRPMPDLSENFTISTWISPDNQQGNDAWILGQNHPSTPYGSEWANLMFKSGKVTFTIPNGVTVTDPTAPTLNAWASYVVTVAWDGSKSVVTLYKNGLQVATAQSATRFTNPNPTRSVYLGNRSSDSNGRAQDRFVGMMDDVRFYKRALSAQDVRALYFEGGYGR